MGFDHDRVDWHGLFDRMEGRYGPWELAHMEAILRLADHRASEMAATAEAPIDPTLLCLLFGQGHQHFLDRLAGVPAHAAPPPRGRGRSAITLTAAQCLAEALFEPWHRSDPTFSFRCDPKEDVRYVLMAGNPTDAAYKSGTQHAAIGLSILTVAPEVRVGRVRAAIVGGHWDGEGFSQAWPLWCPPASLAAIRNLVEPSGPESNGAVRRDGYRGRHVGAADFSGQIHGFQPRRLHGWRGPGSINSSLLFGHLLLC